METQKCVLYDRDCIGCLECEMCDLDPNKVCDNCGKCLDIRDYAVIKIDGIVGAPQAGKKDNQVKAKRTRSEVGISPHLHR